MSVSQRLKDCIQQRQELDAEYGIMTKDVDELQKQMRIIQTNIREKEQEIIREMSACFTEEGKNYRVIEVNGKAYLLNRSLKEPRCDLVQEIKIER